MNNLNILILSVGTRNKLVSYFVKEFFGVGNIIATDCDELAPALYQANKHYIVPRISEENYLDVLIEICKKEQIKAMFSLIDPELTLIAKNRQKFIEIGVNPIVSDEVTIETCLNKFKMSCFLSQSKFYTIASYICIEDFEKAYHLNQIDFPVIVKPICGSCSANITKVKDMETLYYVMKGNNELMVQELIEGNEYGVDVYIDMLSHETVSLFAKRKILMRAGETDKSVSVKIPALFETVLNFTKALPFYGHIDIDLLEKNGDFYISDVNPRFGGGYPHAYECGVNFPKLILRNLQNIANEVKLTDYDENVIMMKYVDLYVRRGTEIE